MGYLTRAQRAIVADLEPYVGRPVHVTVDGPDGTPSTARGVLLRVGGPIAYVSLRGTTTGRSGTVKAPVENVTTAVETPVTW